MVHPIPDDMGMVVRLPGAVITRDLIVTFVSVKVDLERLDL